MERRGNELYFDDEEQRVAGIPEMADISDIYRIRSIVCGCLTTTSDRMDTYTSDPIRGQKGTIADLHVRMSFLASLDRQLTEVIEPAKTSSVEQFLRDRNNNPPTHSA